MANWREAADRGEWDAICWERLSDDDQEQLLKVLQAAIPKFDRIDGYERVLRHDKPDEAKLRAENEVTNRKWSGRKAKRFIQNQISAAIMLANLEAIYGDEVDWVLQVNSYAEEILRDGGTEPPENRQKPLHSLTSSPASPQPNDPDDQSEHAPELTADAHARRALEHVADYKLLIGLARRDATTDEDAEWLIQMIEDAAATGYWAGRRIQAASGKGIEYEARTLKPKAEKYDRIRKGSKKPRLKRHEEMKAKFTGAMTKMRRSIGNGMSVSSAAELVSKQYIDADTGKPKDGFSPANLRKRYREQKAD